MKNGFRTAKGVIWLEGDELKKLQKELLAILKDCITVMEKHDFHYTMGGGSALGTIRHQGFIPWDDDIDLNLPRSEFAAFSRIFQQELGDRYVLCSPESGEMHGLAHCQIKKRGTVFRSFNELKKKECGISIDLFIGENVPDNPVLRRFHGLLCLGAGYLLTCRKTAEDYDVLQNYLTPGSVQGNIFHRKAVIGKMISFLSLDQVSRMTAACYSMCRNGTSEWISFPSGRKHYFGEMYRRKEMFCTQEGIFEGIRVRIPAGMQDYMRCLYGADFMIPPPPEEREKHPVMELAYGRVEKEETV